MLGGGFAGFHGVGVAGDQRVVQRDAGFGEGGPVTGAALHGGGGVFRAHDQPDPGVAVVDEFAGGQVAAEVVVADRGGVDAVGAQDQDLPAVAVDAQRGTDAGGGADDPVDPAVQQGLHRDPLRVGVVLGGGDDGEQAAGGGRGGDLLVEHGHHGVGEPGHDHPDGAGAGPAHGGRQRVTDVAEVGGGHPDPFRGRGFRGRVAVRPAPGMRWRCSRRPPGPHPAGVTTPASSNRCDGDLSRIGG